jgi:hypothetical protein
MIGLDNYSEVGPRPSNGQMTSKEPAIRPSKLKDIDPDSSNSNGDRSPPTRAGNISERLLSEAKYNLRRARPEAALNQARAQGIENKVNEAV